MPHAVYDAGVVPVPAAQQITRLRVPAPAESLHRKTAPNGTAREADKGRYHEA